MNHPTADFHIIYGSKQCPNPNEIAPRVSRELDLMTDDMTDRLLANGKRITACIFDGDEASLNCAEVHTLGNILAALMTCPRNDLIDHLQDLRTLFSRPLKAEAEQMAITYLEAQEVD